MEKIALIYDYNVETLLQSKHRLSDTSYVKHIKLSYLIIMVFTVVIRTCVENIPEILPYFVSLCSNGHLSNIKIVFVHRDHLAVIYKVPGV